MQPSLRRHLPGLWHPVLPWLLAAIRKSSGSDSMVLVREDRWVMREARSRSSIVAGFKPSTFFWCGHSTSHRLASMKVPM